MNRYQPIYASAILSFKGMWCWLDLHTAMENRGRLGPWPYLISIWQSEVTVTMLHVYSRLKFYNASMSLMHICPMSYADFYVDGSDNRTLELMPGGLRCLIYYPLFRREWASYTSDCNKRWTAQLKLLQRHLFAPSCSSSKPNRKGMAAGEELSALVFRGNSPDFPSAISALSVSADTDVLSEFWMECNLFSIVLVCWSSTVILLQGRMPWMSPQWLNAGRLILA